MLISTPLPSFESLVEIARDNPEQLDELRRAYTQANINSAPKHLRQRLRGLQFTIDSTLQSAKNPVARCVKLSRLLHESFDQLHWVLTEPVSYLDTSSSTTAKVVPLKPRDQNDSNR